MKPSAIVTGGASGIGLAAAEWLLDDGWPVAIIDTNREALAEAEDMLAGENAIFLYADIADEDEIADAFDQAVDALGPLGGLVNIAVAQCDLPATETSAALLRQVLDANLVAGFMAAKAAVERMGEALSIVNVASISGLRASDGRLAYGASVAGLKHVSEVLALELAPRDVRVNCIAHGLLDGGATRGDEETRRRWLERVPQRRCGEADEVAAAIAFLVSPAASYITGQTLAVDGGFMAAGLMRPDPR